MGDVMRLTVALGALSVAGILSSGLLFIDPSAAKPLAILPDCPSTALSSERITNVRKRDQTASGFGGVGGPGVIISRQSPTWHEIPGAVETAAPFVPGSATGPFDGAPISQAPNGVATRFPEAPPPRRPPGNGTIFPLLPNAVQAQPGPSIQAGSSNVSSCRQSHRIQPQIIRTRPTGQFIRTKRRRPLRDVPATDTRTAWKSRLSPLAREAQSLANNRFSELWWSTNNLRHGSGTYLTIRGERRMVSVFVPSDSPTQPNIANCYWVYRGRGRRESDTTKPSTRHIFEVVARP